MTAKEDFETVQKAAYESVYERRKLSVLHRPYEIFAASLAVGFATSTAVTFAMRQQEDKASFPVLYGTKPGEISPSQAFLIVVVTALVIPLVYWIVESLLLKAKRKELHPNAFRKMAASHPSIRGLGVNLDLLGALNHEQSEAFKNALNDNKDFLVRQFRDRGSRPSPLYSILPLLLSTFGLFSSIALRLSAASVLLSLIVIVLGMVILNSHHIFMQGKRTWELGKKSQAA